MTTSAEEVDWRSLPDEVERGTHGMVLFIVTEGVLFLVLFFAYFYLGHRSGPWPTHPPKLTSALLMLAVLLLSSVVLWWGERRERRGGERGARAAITATVLLGLAFLGLQAREYQERLRELRPSTDAYGSVFYLITSFHGVHVVMGLAMLLYVLVLPWLGAGPRSPHRPLHNAALYWHFVDGVWVTLVAILYLLPKVWT